MQKVLRWVGVLLKRVTRSSRSILLAHLQTRINPVAKLCSIIELARKDTVLFGAMKKYIEFKAGSKILTRLRDEGLDSRLVSVFTGPAGGPKWFVSVGFDTMLMKTDFLCHGNGRVLLAGSSAGAWRCLAMACKDPLAAYENLRIAYSRNIFTAEDTPVTVSEALARNVEAFLSDDNVDYVLNHPHYDLAVHAVRARGLTASENKRLQGGAILVAALANALTPKNMGFFFERVVFVSGPELPDFVRSFKGRAIRMNEENVRKAALATGSLPYIVKGVTDIAGAPPGIYRDGGITDYQLNQDYCPRDGSVTLFFHYQERIVPGWFDKLITWRVPQSGVLDRVLQVFPGPDFLELLPDGRLPDREDFRIFVNDPGERIRRWDKVSELSEILGQEFGEAVTSGSIRHLVRPL